MILQDIVHLELQLVIQTANSTQNITRSSIRGFNIHRIFRICTLMSMKMDFVVTQVPHINFYELITRTEASLRAQGKETYHCIYTNSKVSNVINTSSVLVSFPATKIHKVPHYTPRSYSAFFTHYIFNSTF